MEITYFMVGFDFFSFVLESGITSWFFCSFLASLIPIKLYRTSYHIGQGRHTHTHHWKYIMEEGNSFSITSVGNTFVRWISLLICSADLCSALICRLRKYQTAPCSLLTWMALALFPRKMGLQAEGDTSVLGLIMIHGLDMGKVWDKAAETCLWIQQHKPC